MRDGLPVVALVVSVVALVVALWGISRGPEKPETLPAEQLEQTKRQLDKLVTEKMAMRKQMDALRAKVTMAIESDRAAQEGGPDRAKIESAVKEAVDRALRARLADEAKKAGAPQAGATKVQLQFDGMVAAIAKELKLDAGKSAAARAVLDQLRAELNRAYRNRDRNVRASLAKVARTKADRELAKALSPAEFVGFKNWRRNSEDAYVKRFFGL